MRASSIDPFLALSLEVTGPSRVDPKGENQRLKKACQEFESIFLAQLLKEMRSTLPKGGLFGNSREEEYFKGLFDQELAKEMAQSGGIGLWETLYRELSSKKR